MAECPGRTPLSLAQAAAPLRRALMRGLRLAPRGRRREHYQWNMDVIGVPGVEAEAELLAAITTFFARVGLGPGDVGIKASARVPVCASCLCAHALLCACVLPRRHEKPALRTHRGEAGRVYFDGESWDSNP